MKKLLLISFSVLFIVSCGGGGGGGSTPSTPTVNLSAEPTSVLLETTSTLTWSSSNATSCSASWTSQTGTSGSEAEIITAVGSNSFSISCTGAGGSRSASVTVEGYRETDGVVVDGYISGAEVCIDEDDSWTCDSNENSTTSDNEGKFTIRYANGNLVSIGGTDLDSQTLLDNLLITHKLTGHSDFKAVTPVTSVAAFMEDASLVNAALGIDSSIDVFTFDPVANKGDGGINDYLYEKGNQLTVLAFALQNITNNLNNTSETTQDYFKAITDEIEKEYTETETKVDIETETFITKALENVISAKSVTIDETAKANTTKALAGVIPVIEVKPSDDLTTGVIRFAVSTLQTDIQAIANGTATAETVTSYSSDVLTYIAEDQNIDVDEITPDISAIADSATTSEDTAVTINVVANDSYLTSAPISVIAGNGTNGITSIAESSPEQITYQPNADYNGTDTFSYTITQGDKTSSADVTVTIEAVNDAPSIDVASTIQVAENQKAVTAVSVSDVDEDELTLTLGGTDADSFNLSDENVLTFKEAPDYETKNSYSITLTLTDGTETVPKDVTIAITNINDNSPEFTSSPIFSAVENQTAIGTVTATDVDGDGIVYSISGYGISINASSGVLTFALTPDYETKTIYTSTVKASDGVNSNTQDITVNITNDESDDLAVNTISGEAIDGYISGAEIFIDKNFNFKKDGDEYTATTDENGAFTIDVIGDSYACLVNRPIVANVPVGAVDSTLGEVTEAYQMILPSISDSGASTVVISPFSTIFSEAIIKAKEEANIKDELTSVEACGTEGNQIASEISKRITEVKTSVESTYGITYEDILSDFIESGSSGVISEATAQNIATYFRPIKELQDNISSSMTSALGLPIIANITFERDVIDSIFSGSTLSELPLDFYSVYTTETNDLGWRREVNFRANGAKVDQDGNINAFKCLDNPASDCVSSELNIENLGNFSEDYRQTVGFYYGSGNGTQVSIGNATGVMVVDASDVKYFFESEGQDRFSCGVEEQIQLQGDSSDDVYWEYKYQTNYDESNSATNGCGGNDVDSSARRGSIEILRRDSSTQTSIGTSYVMPDMDNTTLFSSTPKKLIENFETVDPKGILEEIATFPTDYYELEAARERLSGKEELQYTYSERYSNSNFKTQYNLKIYSDTHPDSAADSLTVTNYAEDGSISSSASYTGTSALETFDNFVSSKSDDMSSLFYAQGNVINGEVMDGYISGADVFIDQNFNFIKDSGEVSAKTFSDGSFKLRVLDDDQYACLISRPIVANVPVGAVDSTLGTVTKAYQMILPSISDSGVNAIVISPFTSILSETILSAKENSDDFVEDLTLEEGCGEKGNQLAARISSELESLESTIETGFGIDVTNLYTDFIELESSGLISEQSAQNIATIFPYIKQVNDEISDYLTEKYNKTIRANVALGQESLDIIFSGESFDKLPLSFTSIYETNPNSEGWYQREEITASRGYISNTGVLSREYCSESDTTLCNITEITLDNIANTATSYHRQSNFLNDNLTIDGIAEGSIAVYAWDARDWRNDENNDVSLWQEPDNRSRECRGTNDVQFQVSSPETLSNYHYSSYSQGYGQADCSSYKRYYYPKLNIATIYDREIDDNSIQVNYYIPDVVRTGVTSNLPFDFIKNQVSINPSELIKDLDDLPRFPKDIDEIRRKLVGDDYVLFEYHHDPHISYFEFGTFPRNDTFIKDSDFNTKLYGQAARDAWFAELQTEPTFDSGVYGSQPTGSKALGYLSKPWMQITDYYGSENTPVNYDIYPTYDAQTKTLDLSLKGAELDLENIKEFIENGINGKPIDAKIYINPDNAVTGTMPLKLSLYHGTDDVAGEGEDYFTIEFDIQVSASASGLEMSISAEQQITAKYISGSVVIEKVITNGDEDKIVITDNENGLQRPSSLTNKVFTLLQEVAEEINGIKNFFSDGGEYYFKVDMGGGDKFSIVDYYFNTVDYMVGTFKTASSPVSGIFVRDVLKISEGSSEQVCFTRNAGTNSLAETTFNISFTERDRPGRGGDANDFTLSSDTIAFADGETESCITVTAESDKHFDWITELRFDLTDPSSGEGLARNQFLVRIYNDNSATNTLSGIPGNPGESMPISGSN